MKRFDLNAELFIDVCVQVNHNVGAVIAVQKLLLCVGRVLW